MELLPFDAENLYPASMVKERPARMEPIKTEIKAVAEKQEPKMFLWENAFLTWSPGNLILKAEKDGKKAELKIEDKSFVPETIQKQLFDKMKSVTTKITVEQTGNAYKIVTI